MQNRFQNFIYTTLLSFIVLCSFEATAQKSDTRPSRYNILHYEVGLDFTDLLSRTLSATCLVEGVLLQDTVRTIQLDLLKQRVDSLSGTLKSYSYNDTLLSITLPGGFAAGDTFRVRVNYGGAPYVESQWGGWYFQGSYVFNLGVGFQTIPHNLGRVWHPCVDNFTERATYDVLMKVRTPMVAVGSGVLESKIITGTDTIHYHWSLQQPIPAYLYGISISDYEHIADTLTGITNQIPTDIYVRPGQQTQAVNSFKNLPHALATFEKRFGPYRWPRIGYSMTTRGAMEHAMNISFPFQNINGSLAEESRIAHELSHHWWGNLVTCASAEEMWINEGMAVFCEYLYLEDIYGVESAKQEMQNNLFDVVRNAHLDEGGYHALDNVPQEHTYGKHSYKKGSLIAWNLRKVMGDSLFFDALTEFVQSRAFSAVSSRDFEAFVSNRSGINLRPFFEQWVYQGGMPVFDIGAYNYNQATGKATGHIRQTKGGNSHGITDFEVALRCYDSLGFHQDFPIKITGNKSNFDVAVPFQPVYLALNAEREVNYASTASENNVFSIGSLNATHTLLSASVTALIDSAFLRLESFWGAPYIAADNQLNVKAWPNPRRYWRIDGIASESTRLNWTTPIDANAGMADEGLIRNSGDSLVVLYRRHPWQPWTRFSLGNYTINLISPARLKGYLQITNAPLGEYVLAESDYTLAGSAGAENREPARIYPNPTDRIIYCNKAGILRIFSLTGILLVEKNIEAHSEWTLKDLPRGCILWMLDGADGLEYGKLILK